MLFSNRPVYYFLLEFPLLWSYTSDGVLLGVLDWSRVTRFLSISDFGDAEYQKYIQQCLVHVEIGAKSERDKMVQEGLKRRGG